MNRRRLVYPLLAAVAAATILVADHVAGRDAPRAPTPAVPPLLPGGSGATSIRPATKPRPPEPAPAAAPAAPTAPPSPAPTRGDAPPAAR